MVGAGIQSHFRNSKAKSDEHTIRVGFSNSYRGTSDDAAILRAAGEAGARFFKQSFELKIKGNLIPETAVEELIGELHELFARHNAGVALTAKAVFKPNKDFHTARHTLFTPEQNLEIDSRASSGRCETDAAARRLVFLGGAAQGLTSGPLLVFCENLFL